MASHNNAEQHEPSPELPPKDSQSDVEEDVNSEVDEEEVKSWLSTKYKRGSKKPMKVALTAPWGLAISNADLEKLKTGFKSQSMDDKWDLLVEDPDESGGISIHIIRNWLQLDCYILHISPEPSGDDHDGEGAKIIGITWEGDKNSLQCGAEQAQKEAVMLCRGWLDCEFETLPQYPSSVFWDPSAYKKLGEPEGQAGSNGASSTAGGENEAREEYPGLKLHVMSLGSRYWNESQ